MIRIAQRSNIFRKFKIVRSSADHLNTSPLFSRHVAPMHSRPNPDILYRARFYEESEQNYRPGGYHPVTIGETYNGRYKVIRKLGYGKFSTTWLVLDDKSNSYACLKILLSSNSRTTSEIDILRNIANPKEPHSGIDFTIKYLDHFQHTGPNGTHNCIVTELLGRDITALCEPNSVKLPLEIVKQVTLQLLLSLIYLHDQCGVVHTDLKMDNILLVPRNPGSLLHNQSFKAVNVSEGKPVSQSLPLDLQDNIPIQVKLIDFGNACWTDKPNSQVIQPHALRAPEVILGAEWDTSADIWNLGCLVYEMMTSRLLFHWHQDDKDEQHIQHMVELLGEFPEDVIKAGKDSHKFFDSEGRLLQGNGQHTPLPIVVQEALQDKHSTNEIIELSTFLLLCLAPRKSDRATALELAQDDWLKDAREKILALWSEPRE